MRFPRFHLRPLRLAGIFAAALVLSATASLAQNTISIPGATPVGQQAATVTVTVTMTANGTAAAPQALTLGVQELDYALASGGTCAAGVAYSANQQCTVNVAFSPLFPGLRLGAIVVRSSNGSLLGETLLNATGTAPLAVLDPGSIDTVAGNGDWIYAGDGMLATQSPVFLPTGVLLDGQGNIFFSDSSNNRIRRVDAQTGLISTYAGNGTPGYNGDGILATLAAISQPAALALDGAGNLYFVDSGNHAIRRVDAVSGIITTVAGIPTKQGYTGDGAAASAAKLYLPEGLALDTADNLYIADTGNNVIREVSVATGIISTIAGIGVSGFNGDGYPATQTLLASPWGVAVSPGGLLYIADSGNNRIRELTADGSVTTIAGYSCRGFSGDGGVAPEACLNAPSSVAFDPAGSVYIADSGNNRVRKVDISNDWIETLSGGDSEQFAGDTGPANLAGLYGPSVVFFDANGNLFVTDMFHNRVRKISASALPLHYDTMRVGKVSSPLLATVVNDGNAALTFSGPTLVYAAVDALSTTCTTGFVLQVDLTCNYGIDFAPTITGNPLTGFFTVNSDAPNTSPVITLTGNVLSVNPTNVTLVSSLNPSLVNASVTFTATVTNGGGTPTGSVSFLDGTTQICAATLSSTATTVCVTTSLALGQHSITANYQGDTYNASSVSAPLSQVVQQPSALTLTASPNPEIVSGTVTLTATATAASGTPTGAIKFYSDNASLLGTSTMNSFGVASLPVSQLVPGTHPVFAQYDGDLIDAGAQSNVLSEVIQQAPTSTTISTSNASVVVGSAVTFTASVSAPNGPPPTGSVTFTDGYTPIGTGTLSSSGTASLQSPALTPGTHNIIATYNGDVNDSTSASSPLLETIQQISTVTTLADDANPASAGAMLHLTAHVALAAGAVPDGVISGQASFSDGTTVLGIVTLDANDNAVLATNTLAVGTHHLTATYSGNTNYATSTSAPLSEVVISTSSVNVLSSSNLNALAGKPVTFTATITTPTGIPTGAVAFRDGSLTLGQGTLNAQGLATFSTSTLAVGSHAMTAAYAGDANYLGSASAPLTETISIATTALALAGPATPVNAGISTTLSGTLTGNGVAPTGTLTLRDGGTAIATQTIQGSSFTFSSSSFSVGTHTLTATYAGDIDNAPATSNVVALVVQLAPTTTSLASSANPQVVTHAVTLTASVTSISPGAGGTISFADGSTVLASIALVNGSANYTTSGFTVGSHSLTATYSGDTNHAASTSPSIAQQIVQVATLALTSSLNPSVSGTNVAFTAQLTGVGSLAPTGHIVFADGSASLGSVAVSSTGAASFSTAALKVGSHNIAAAYAGDANYAAASASLTQTVQSASTQIALTASANPATYSTPLSLTATITTDGGVATGTVSFTDGGTAIGSASLNASGVATLTLSTLRPGPHNIVANYAGDGKAGASASTPLVVTVKETTQTALASSANPAQTLSSITLTAAVTNSGVGTASGSITFYDGTALLGTASLDATGHATLVLPSLTVGSHSLQASYAGDGSNFSSVSSLLTQVVQLRPTTTALTASQTNPNDPLQVTLIALVQPATSAPTPPTGTITFTVGGSTLGSSDVDATGVATLTIELQANTETITASYSGDVSFAASQSTPSTVTGGPATQFTMTLNPSSVTVQSKQHIVVSLMLTSVKDFADTLQLGCLGLPVDATCTFSTTQVKLPSNGAVTVQLTIDTGNPLGAGSSAKLDRSPVVPDTRTSSHPLLCFLPLGILAAVLLRSRRRVLPALLMALLMFAGALSLSGCSGLQVNGTPPGSYVFRVTAAGVGTGATQSQSVNLTVTP